MKNPLAALWLLIPTLVAAQSAPPDPSDPAAPVRAPAYRSVFADTPRGVEADLTDWKKANADVGQFRRGHIDLLKWEEERAGRAQGAPAPATPAPATPAHVHPHTPGGKP
jgi:hypothetical protein